MKKIFFLIPILFLTGCATVSQIDSKDTSDGIKWSELKESGISEDASRNAWNGQVDVKGRTNFFTPEITQITWWGVFGSTTFMWGAAKFTAKWYEPGGKLVQEKPFTTSSMIDSQFYKASLPTKEVRAFNFPGEWKVEILHKDKVIDRRKFTLGVLPEIKPEPKLELKRESEPVAAQIPVSAPFAPAASSKAPIHSATLTFFEKNYKTAGEFFKNDDFGSARTALEMILNEEPFRTEAHLGLAAISFREKNWELCLKELDYLIQNPDYRERAMGLRKLAQDMQKGIPFDDAKAALKKIQTQTQQAISPQKTNPVVEKVLDMPKKAAFAPRKDPSTSEVRISPVDLAVQPKS